MNFSRSVFFGMFSLPHTAGYPERSGSGAEPYPERSGMVSRYKFPYTYFVTAYSIEDHFKKAPRDFKPEKVIISKSMIFQKSRKKAKFRSFFKK